MVQIELFLCEDRLSSPWFQVRTCSLMTIKQTIKQTNVDWQDAMNTIELQKLFTSWSLEKLIDK